MHTLTLEAIGTVHNEVKEPVDANWHKVTSQLHLRPDLVAGLQGLEDWSHVVVIYLMHQQEAFDVNKHLVRRPRERADMPELGIFAQRARHRPNQMGITAVKLVGVEGHVVTVRGLDAIDGTPILDIKPYAPIYDGVSNPLVPSWFIQLMQGYF